jgi:hypothetical protein
MRRADVEGRRATYEQEQKARRYSRRVLCACAVLYSECPSAALILTSYLFQRLQAKSDEDWEPVRIPRPGSSDAGRS